MGGCGGAGDRGVAGRPAPPTPPTSALLPPAGGGARPARPRPAGPGRAVSLAAARVDWAGGRRGAGAARWDARYLRSCCVSH